MIHRRRCPSSAFKFLQPFPCTKLCGPRECVVSVGRRRCQGDSVPNPHAKLMPELVCMCGIRSYVLAVNHPRGALRTSESRRYTIEDKSCCQTGDTGGLIMRFTIWEHKTNNMSNTEAWFRLTRNSELVWYDTVRLASCAASEPIIPHRSARSRDYGSAYSRSTQGSIKYPTRWPRQ